VKGNNLSWGDVGFYWVSYYDKVIGTGLTAYTAS